jgi:hypothetical protein
VRIEQRIATGWDGLGGRGAATSRSSGGSARQRSAVPPSLAAATPIVGRRRELAALVDTATAAEQSGPSVVLVSGESGIGKTSLLAALAGFCASRPGWSVHYARCSEFVREPFQPFGALLGHVVDSLAEDEIASHAARCGGDLARIVPQLRSQVPHPGSAAVDDPATARHLLFHAAADVTRRAAAAGPIALLVDDLHWAEPSGLELLRQLVVDLAGLPVLVVVAYRDTGDARGDHLRSTVADLVRAGATHVALGGLDADELGDLVRTRVDAAADSDVDEIVELLEAETTGNPLFAEHLLRFWSESDRLGVGDTTVTLGGAGAGPLPATLRDLIWQRVGVLGPESRDVLCAAAVLGVEFEEAALEAMVADRRRGPGGRVGQRDRGRRDRAGTRVRRRRGSPMRSWRAASSPNWVAVPGPAALDGTRRAVGSRSVPRPGGATRPPRRARRPAAEAQQVGDGRRRRSTRRPRRRRKPSGGTGGRSTTPARSIGRPADLAELTVRLGDAATRAGDPAASTSCRKAPRSHGARQRRRAAGPRWR